MGFARQLMAHYEYRDGKLLFDDGTEYAISEALFISELGLPTEDIEAIHLLKRKFAGELTGATVNGVHYAIETDDPKIENHGDIDDVPGRSENDGLDGFGASLGETKLLDL